MAMTRNLRFVQFPNDLNKVITEDEFINQTGVKMAISLRI